jgi:chemotaxis signal transduction protein
MHERMGIGKPIAMDRFVDLRFAEKAYRTCNQTPLTSRLNADSRTAEAILNRSGEVGSADSKSKLNLEGKYLAFGLGGQEFGIDILKIKEIVGMQRVHAMPDMPGHMQGVINLRGKMIPVMNLKERFGMGTLQENSRNCIVVLETAGAKGRKLTGLAVETVSEVMAIKPTDIEPTPPFGLGVDTRHILAMAKTGRTGVKLLLNIDHILAEETAAAPS